MMEFHEFCDYLKDHVKEYLPPEYDSATVIMKEIQKNNGTELMGLSIRTEDSPISPNIYLNNYYQEYRQGMDVELALERIAEVYLQHKEPSEALSSIAQDFQDVDYIKSHIVIGLVNAEKNAKMLEDMPHRLKEDLAIIYKVFIGSQDDCVATVTVKDAHMKEWGISPNELHECAMKNSRELMPVQVEDIGSVLSAMGMPVEMFGQSREPMLYVISNAQKCNGAAAILYSDCLQELSEKLGSDLYILPSSVHETLALAASGETNVESLAQMVREVNATQVSEQEQLSDHVYRYDARARSLTLADVSAKDLKIGGASEEQPEGETKNAEAARPRRHR
ncbi:MAG: DUF5688 family protein [Lachnospiraceae bacterium]|nr:DUF5688 family protein [Lachnospiraceae bacterium]